METFSIVDKINVDKLNTKIAEFVYREGHEPYIFANKETLDALIKPIEQEFKFVSAATGIVSSFKSCCIGKYQDNKTFRDDTLKFGEIELR
ncbi:hypothetical protein [uncultured Eubacterium sp.]|uniref:hypothetical protein n=1 Tax=uncultured Eubacterium sp. TaxID=165185 RepID=UPI002635BD6A|nr:hypothetical protein [uncultured Eubacterium sp.]